MEYLEHGPVIEEFKQEAEGGGTEGRRGKPAVRLSDLSARPLHWTMPTTIHVAHSPDSDDAFMFYALAEGKIDTGDLQYVHELADIETLNQRALPGRAGGHRGLDPRLRLPLARLRPAELRLLDGRRLRSPAGLHVARAPGPARGARRPAGRGPGHADHGLPGAPALPAGLCDGGACRSTRSRTPSSGARSTSGS